jgi:hypothetical protein
MAHNINFNEQTGKHSFFSDRYVKLYITVTGYYQNVKNYKTADDKLSSILFGTGLQRSQTAFRLCEQFQQHGADAFQMN